ncbi:hypothetical protein ACWEP4_28315 [Streptomyces sp. NPDC004227]
MLEALTQPPAEELARMVGLAMEHERSASADEAGGRPAGARRSAARPADRVVG